MELHRVHYSAGDWEHRLGFMNDYDLASTAAMKNRGTSR